MQSFYVVVLYDIDLHVVLMASEGSNGSIVYKYIHTCAYSSLCVLVKAIGSLKKDQSKDFTLFFILSFPFSHSLILLQQHTSSPLFNIY